MTKFILTIVIIALVLTGAWMLHKEWSKYSSGTDIKEDEAAAALVINPQTLPGMPNGLEQSYGMAETAGVTGLKNWLKLYGDSVQDPRRAWIELDYMVLIARTDPVEAKKIFADIKDRIPTNSPVYPRIRHLEKTYE
jgi:hypothetical protein